MKIVLSFFSEPRGARSLSSYILHSVLNILMRILPDVVSVEDMKLSQFFEGYG